MQGALVLRALRRAVWEEEQHELAQKVAGRADLEALVTVMATGQAYLGVEGEQQEN